MTWYQIAGFILTGWLALGCILIIPAASFCATNVYDEAPDAEPVTPL